MSENNIMKEKLLLIGAGTFGRAVSEQAILNYDCAFVDDGFSVGDTVCDIPVVGHISDLETLRSNYDKLVVVIGNNKLREQIYQKARGLEYTFLNIVSSSAYISPFAKIGWGCIILQNVVIENKVKIGNGVLLNAGIDIRCDSCVDDYVLIYSNSVVHTQVHIGRCVRIGGNVTISNGVVVPDGMDVKNGATLY